MKDHSGSVEGEIEQRVGQERRNQKKIRLSRIEEGRGRPNEHAMGSSSAGVLETTCTTFISLLYAQSCGRGFDYPFFPIWI